MNEFHQISMFLRSVRVDLVELLTVIKGGVSRGTKRYQKDVQWVMSARDPGSRTVLRPSPVSADRGRPGDSPRSV